MTLLDSLDVAAGEFGRRLAAVIPADWDNPTPCEGWTVRDLVNHGIGGNVMAAVLLAGASKDEASAAVGGESLTDDPASAYADSVARQAAGFAEEGSLDKVVHHPAMDMPGGQLLGFRVVDLGVHAWDLAQAIGADETLDDGLVQAMWDVVAPMAPFIGQIGVFGPGPSGDVGEDAPLQQRVLDMVGRRP